MFKGKKKMLSLVLALSMALSVTVYAGDMPVETETAQTEIAVETEIAETEAETEVIETEAEVTETEAETEAEVIETEAAETEAEITLEGDPEEVKNGLVQEEDGLYYYVNGEPFTKGLLQYTDADGKTCYSYFDTDGKAFTAGYKPTRTQNHVETDAEGNITVVADANPDQTIYYYYFQNNGKAFTGGLLEYTVNEKTYYSYYDTDGKAYTNGYKPTKTQSQVDADGNIVSIPNTSGTVYYYYFQSNSLAFNKGLLQFVNTNGNTYYFYFQSNGQAYTKGYKSTKTQYTANDPASVKNVTGTSGTVYYYYFQSNGQAYTKGLKKFKHTNGKTYLFYFQSNGKGFNNGWTTINGNRYYFDAYAHGYFGGLKSIGGKKYYFTSAGAAQKGWLKVSGTWSYFDESTYALQFQSNVMYNAWYKIKSRSSATSYFIVTDTGSNWVMIFKGSEDNWVPYKLYRCTSGAASTKTVKGTFTVKYKGYCFHGNTYTCYYYTQFYGDYLFHSVLYWKNTFNIKDGRLGRNLSHGCVRLDIANAKWIYNNVPYGTKVYIY